ncbi:MAG: hypothetical protein GY867_12405, partial [bacterium]|nr:hypothetical protein [bacterium]
MKRTNLILTLSALFVLILTSPGQLLAQDTTGFDLEFVDCPEEFTVDRADSAYFHFQAVPVSNEKLCPEIHYVIVSGPGQIDSLTGWWSFYPFFEDPAPEPFYEVEVAAFFVG